MGWGSIIALGALFFPGAARPFGRPREQTAPDGAFPNCGHALWPQPEHFSCANSTAYITMNARPRLRIRAFTASTPAPQA